MIRNLNQVSFQGFGTVLPERTQNNTIAEKGELKTVRLTCEIGPVFYAEEDLWLTCGSGSSVLSVSADDTQYSHYYLDKQVCIRKGVYFALNSLWGDATALMASQTPPRLLGSRDVVNVKLGRKLRVDAIYTFFYHEKEQGFLFPGESHPMLELTYVDQGSLHSVVDGQDMSLKQGDLVVYGPGQWHMQYADIGMAPRYITITFDAAGVELESLLNRKFVASQQAAKLLQLMLREQERMDEYSGDMILSQLSQLLLNLMINAFHAMTPDGGVLTLSTRREEENVIFTVSDTGCGIPEKIRDKIFDPFFTTKESGAGTGLGLAIAQQVVSEHNGSLFVDSEEGKGTAFRVVFSLSEEHAPLELD